MVLPLVLISIFFGFVDHAAAASFTKSLKLNLEDQMLNLDSEKIESTFILIREHGTQKLVAVELQETNTSSGIFTGSYDFPWTSGSVENIAPQIYVPDAENKSLTKEEFIKKVESNTEKRKPFLIRKDQMGEQNIDIYLSKEKALDALSKYRRGYGEKKDAELNPDKIKRKLKYYETERVRLNKIEQIQTQERNNKLSRLSDLEKQNRKQQAVEVSKLALQNLNKNELVLAEQNFRRAMDLDPETSNYYYSYAVTLFKEQKYNESIVVLELLNSAEGSERKAEQDYYLALNYYNLQDQKKAQPLFHEVAQTEFKSIASSASFYDGLNLFENKKYEQAKDAFQKVMDLSEDLELDKQSELFIETIEKILAFEKLKLIKYFITYAAGLQYDSNILFTPDGSSTSATESQKGGLRYILSGGLEYRPIFDEIYEFSIKGGVNYIYSIDALFNRADPLGYSLSAPFKFKEKLFNKDYKLEAGPTIDVLYMDPNNTGTKINVSNTYGAYANNAFVLSDKWISNVNFVTGYNNSKTTSGDDSTTGLKMGFLTSNIYFLNNEKSKGVVGDLGYSLTNANGSNQRFNKLDVAFTYLMPAFSEGTFNTKFAFSSSIYPGSTAARADKNYTASASYSKALGELLSLGLNATYSSNFSNVDAYKYNKYTAMLVLSGQVSF